MEILKKLYKTDTSIRRTLWLIPRFLRLKRFYCVSGNLTSKSVTGGNTINRKTVNKEIIVFLLKTPLISKVDVD